MSLRELFRVPSTLAERWPSLALSSERGEQALESLGRYERDLWFLAIGAMLVDITLTVHGLQLGLRELNPIARAALEWIGVLGLYGLKAVALLIGGICVKTIPERYTPVVPLGLAVPSVAAVCINTVVISVTITGSATVVPDTGFVR